MKRIACLVLAVALPVSAGCVGTAEFRTCTDSAGNSYTTTRIGDMSFTNGRNYRTGNTWSQNSTNIGGTTFTNGRDAQGNSWHSTTYDTGYGTQTYGLDSDGNYFSAYGE